MFGRDSPSIKSDLKNPEHLPLVMGCDQVTDNQPFLHDLCLEVLTVHVCACLRAKLFLLLLLLVSHAKHSCSDTIFNFSSMRQCEPDSNPTPPRQQAVTLMSRVFESNLILILIRQGHLFEDEKIKIICRKKHFPSLPYLFFFFCKSKIVFVDLFTKKTWK